MKAKLILIATMEYEINPELYPKGMSHEEMLECDRSNYIDDPAMLLDACDSIHVKGEFINADISDKERSCDNGDVE